MKITVCFYSGFGLGPLFTLLRQEALWLATGRILRRRSGYGGQDGIPGFAGFSVKMPRGLPWSTPFALTLSHPAIFFKFNSGSSPWPQLAEAIKSYTSSPHH
ncbi:MAG: hypothetical protein Q8O57_00535, partial [Kiritimatiellota bacterium]|nr:hypothetical protein [Kiritimatiellota bacterium]